MAKKTCYLQHECPYFDEGTNKPPNNDVRDKYPCRKYLNDSCDMPILIRTFYGETIACKIKGGKK